MCMIEISNFSSCLGRFTLISLNDVLLGGNIHSFWDANHGNAETYTISQRAFPGVLKIVENC